MSIGLLIGMSINQGCSGFPALHHVIYRYVVTRTHFNLDIN